MPSYTPSAKLAALSAIADQLLFALQRRLLSPEEIDDLLKKAVESIPGDGRSEVAARRYLDHLWNELREERE